MKGKWKKITLQIRCFWVTKLIDGAAKHLVNISLIINALTFKPESNKTWRDETFEDYNIEKSVWNLNSSLLKLHIFDFWGQKHWIVHKKVTVHELQCLYLEHICCLL